MGMQYEVVDGGTIPVIFGVNDTENYLGKLDAVIEQIVPGEMLAGMVLAPPCIHVRAGSITGFFTTPLSYVDGKLWMEMPEDRIYPVSALYFDSNVEW